jgi:alpha-mannosidase
VLYASRRDDAEHVKLEYWPAPGRTKPMFEEARKHLDGGEGEIIGKGFEFGPSCERLADSDLERPALTL